MKEKKKEIDIDVKRKTFTLFTLFFPTVVILALPNSIEGNFLPIGIKLLLAFYQYVMVKNFIETHYS